MTRRVQESPPAPRLGDVYLMDFDGVGSEEKGCRPGIVFQNNLGNVRSPNIIAIPITSSLKKLNQPTHVFLPASETGLVMDSMALCENPQRLSKQRVGRFISHLPNSYIRKVAAANLIATSAISYLDFDTLVKTWEQTVRLNGMRFDKPVKKS